MKLRPILSLALLGALALNTGCATLLDAALDSALETREERHIRKDRARANNGQPMRHHTGWSDLNAHAEDMERRRVEE